MSRGIKIKFSIPRFTGFVWATAKGRELSLNNLLDIIATTLDYSQYLTLDIEAKRIKINKLFEQISCLLILDNLETVQDQEEAFELARKEGHRLGLASIDRASDDLLAKLYQATGGTPLALKWAVGQIKQKAQPIENILVTIQNARGDIFEHIFM